MIERLHVVRMQLLHISCVLSECFQKGEGAWVSFTNMQMHLTIAFSEIENSIKMKVGLLHTFCIE